jgi:hypothetical protein
METFTQNGSSSKHGNVEEDTKGRKSKMQEEREEE